MRIIRQAGLRGIHVAGNYAPYSKVTTAEGVVIAVYFVDDQKNVSKQYVEYDVRDLRTGQIYQNIRREEQAQGMDDGNDTTLRPAQKLFGATSPVFDPKVAQLSQSDGDRVRLTFSYGAHLSGVITDVLPHPQKTYGATKADGFRRFETHAGTSVETKKDGSYVITRGDTNIKLDASSNVAITHKSGAHVTISDDGDISLVPANGRQVLNGGEASGINVANQPAVLGTLFGADVLGPIETAVAALLISLPPAISAQAADVKVPPIPPTFLTAVGCAAALVDLLALATALSAAISAYPATLSQTVLQK